MTKNLKNVSFQEIASTTVTAMMSRSAVIRARYVPDVRGVNRYKHFHSPLVIEPSENTVRNIVKERSIHELPHLSTGDSRSHPASGRFDSHLTTSNVNGFLSVKGLNVRSSSSNISSLSSSSGIDQINTAILSVATAKSSDESLHLSSSLPLLVSTTTKPLWANSGNNKSFSSLHSLACIDSISSGGLRASLCKSAQNICTGEKHRKRPKVLHKSRLYRSCHAKLSNAIDSSSKQQQQRSSVNNTVNAKASFSLPPGMFACKPNNSNKTVSNNTSSSDDTTTMMAQLSKSDKKRLSRTTASSTSLSATRIVLQQQHQQKQHVQVDGCQPILASLQQTTKQQESNSNVSRNKKTHSQRMVNRKNFAILFVDCASSGRDKAVSPHRFRTSNTNPSSTITETLGTQTSEIVEEEKEQQQHRAVDPVKKALISEPVIECSLVCKATQTQRCAGFGDRVLLRDDELEVDSNKLIDQRRELMNLIELALNETIDKRSKMMTNNFIASSLRKQAEIWRDAKEFVTGILIPQSIRYANTN